jgi:hypothetical protein
MPNIGATAPATKTEEVLLYEQIQKNLRDWQTLLEVLEKKRRQLYSELLATADRQKAKEIYERLNSDK